jgi:hypothetical protein
MSAGAAKVSAAVTEAMKEGHAKSVALQQTKLKYVHTQPCLMLSWCRGEGTGGGSARSWDRGAGVGSFSSRVGHFQGGSSA